MRSAAGAAVCASPDCTDWLRARLPATIVVIFGVAILAASLLTTIINRGTTPKHPQSDAFERSIKDTQQAFYVLGRSAGISAALKAELLGRSVPIKEMESSADDLANIHQYGWESLNIDHLEGSE